ncbi:MAG: hypothetical protein AAB483_00320, partial [Patescibacteria group bacterium]
MEEKSSNGIPIKEMLGTVREGKRMRHEYTDDPISVAGATSKYETKIIGAAAGLLERLEEENQGWLEEKRNKLKDYLADIPDQKVRDLFHDGWRRFVKAQYRTRGRDQGDPHGEFLDESNLRKLIQSYTFDFIRSLRESRKYSVDPAMALRMASNVFRVDPLDLEKMHTMYPEFENWIIETGITMYRDHEAFLKGVHKALQDLRQRYPNREQWLLTAVAVRRHEDPIAYMEDLIRKEAAYL